MKLYTALAALLWTGIFASAQPLAIEGDYNGRHVRVTAVTPTILRVDNYMSGGQAAPEQSVLALGGNIAEKHVSLSDSNSFLRTSGGVEASLAADGTLLLSGVNPRSAIIDNSRRSGDGRQIDLVTNGTGSFYGGGERGHKLNLRGDTLVMYNRQNYGYTGSDPRISQMNITMPLVLSSDGYVLVFDDYAAAQLILGDTIQYITESPLPVTYYYISGSDSMAGLTESLTSLTGRQPLPPLWSLGYITSKYGYRTQAETEGAVDTLRTAGYPLDGIVLDLYWYGKEQDMGRLEWDADQFADPRGMLARLDSLGVKTVTISQPYVLRNGRGINNYNELAPRGMFVADSAGGPQEVKIWVGEGGMFDVSNADTRRWLTDRYRSLTDMGAGGWWGDLGEPEVHPETGVHANGLTTRLYHNKYGNDWSSIISDLYAAEYPDRRLMTLMRGGTTGLQRYSVFPWSTDVSRSWGGLEPQVRIMLNSGLSGLGYMSSDLGGFAVDPDSPYMPELYVRWVEAGLFSPVFRTHAQQFAEPYHYPQYHDILLALVRERYRWLPYNYTLAYENAVKGWPLVRPLDFEHSADGRYDNVSDEYLWGSEVLVAPVMTEGALSRSIVFPEGSRWYDWHNPSVRYDGGTVVADYPAPLDVLPLFVRGGSFIPLADYPMANTGDYRNNSFAIHYFADGGKSSYTLFDDSRMTPGTVERGEYTLIRFDGDDTGDEIAITISTEHSHPEVTPLSIRFDFTLHNNKEAFSEISIVRGNLSMRSGLDEAAITFTVDYTPGADTTITLKR